MIDHPPPFAGGVAGAGREMETGSRDKRREHSARQLGRRLSNAESKIGISISKRVEEKRQYSKKLLPFVLTGCSPPRRPLSARPGVCSPCMAWHSVSLLGILGHMLPPAEFSRISPFDCLKGGGVYGRMGRIGPASGEGGGRIDSKRSGDDTPSSIRPTGFYPRTRRFLPLFPFFPLSSRSADPVRPPSYSLSQKPCLSVFFFVLPLPLISKLSDPLPRPTFLFFYP